MKKTRSISIAVLGLVIALCLTAFAAYSAQKPTKIQADTLVTPVTLSDLGGSFAALTDGSSKVFPDWDTGANLWSANSVNFGTAFELTFDLTYNASFGSNTVNVYFLCDGDNFKRGLRFEIYLSRASSNDVALLFYENGTQYYARGAVATAFTAESTHTITLGYSLVDADSRKE